ncbi:TlyA family RNA methyltransferase [Tumidithrix helvetica PCC 7403]|uniref:TlyA family RNA methyltransferase n=1 Tax=Tumidithrix helvetica TaxID=3457545 RepID=UPI003C91A5B4
MRQRLDILLVELSLVPSREQAQRAIRAGWVQVDRTTIDKPGTLVKSDAQILVKAQSPFVSRGGEKLAGALDKFQVKVSDRICFDGGISTGGFTDCLLKQGASRVYGIDVGYGQVAWEVRSDPRVVLKERTNLRYLQPEQLYQADDPIPDFAVLDLSFISLTKILPALWNLLQSPREVLLLVKPQFEAGKSQVGKSGVIRDAKVRAEAIAQVLDAAIALGWRFQGMTPSPIQGRTGNFEYWLWLNSESELAAPSLEEMQKLTVG